MATIEKPKIKKKKRVRTATNDDSASLDLTNQSLDDINFPTSLTSYGNLISHDCFVSTEFQSTSSIPTNDDNTAFCVDIKDQLKSQETDKSCEITGTVSDTIDILTTDEISGASKTDLNIEENLPSTSKAVSVSTKNDFKQIQSAVESNLSSTVAKSEAITVPTSPSLYAELEASGNQDIKVGSPYPWTHNIEQREQDELEPSAPAIDVHIEPIIKYPSLNQIRLNEENTINIGQKIQSKFSNTPTRELRKVIPFTSEQMKELYCCHEIEMVKKFEMEFLNNSLSDNYESDPLYNLLLQYALVRNKLRVNLIDIAQIQENLIQRESDVWEIKNKTLNFDGKCKDNNTVKGFETYEIAELNTRSLHLLNTDLNKLYELVCFSYTTNNINAEIAKLKIEQIIREILSYSSFSKINTDSPITITKHLDNDTLHSLNHLRRAIAILFTCIRKPPPDQIFTNDLKKWLTNLVALYLRVGTIEDHWFLTFHILRCPSGISTWATSFLQIPHPKQLQLNEVLDAPEINHCISVLYILLLPIKKRHEFLQYLTKSHTEISDPVKDDIWILVDSDGEEGNTSTGECSGLRENDLIAFLNQIPLDMIFRYIINVKKLPNGDYEIESDGITENQLIKLIAFNTNLIELFGNGLLTYNSERYKQFAKRLGRLIRHTIQYVADIHEMFLRNNLSKNPYLCERINVELNVFTIKACSYIYKTPNLATWQYFSSLPFGLLDSETIWQIFYYLNTGFPDDGQIMTVQDTKIKLNDTNFWAKFNLAATDLSAEDLYYLIQTFYEIANERDRIKDWDLIQMICSHIFNIGYINETTKEICYKTSRDMLINLTLIYPELIEILVKDLRNHFNETENIVYLFKSLPLENWKTDIQSFEILSYWLLNYFYECNENIIARVIISHLNWAFDIDNRLFLPHNIHVRMACLICESLNKHNPETVGLSGISESVRQISSLIENQTTKEQFTTWCWNMVALLRLHQMDQSIEIVKTTLFNPAEALYFIPDIDNFPIVFQGVTESRPLSIYVSILISLWGHSVPLICQNGFAQMKLLLNDYRHLIVIRCIQLVVPLFLDAPESLERNETFHQILNTILNSDRTYLKMAKDLVASNSPGPVFKLFINMIQSQIINYIDYGLPNPNPLINLWLKVLTSISNWQTKNVVQLIDAVIKIAYQFPDSWLHCKDFFNEYFANHVDWKSERSSTFKIFSSNQNQNFPCYTTDCAWLALLFLELEFDTQELQNGLWPELLRQLLVSNANIDSVLRKTIQLTNSQSFSSASLVIYKFANLISNMDVEHPLFPILNQKFFTLYLWRVELNEHNFQENYGIADKFYEHNISLMKKMKLKLKQSEEYYNKLSRETVNCETLSYLYAECTKLIKTYLLWLEETNINKISRDQHIDLPPQYNLQKLKIIFNRIEGHWVEYMYMPRIRNEQKDASNKWLKVCFRHQRIKQWQNTNLLSKPRSKPFERITKHLKSYDKNLEPPILEKKPLLLKSLNSKEINAQTLKSLRNELKFLNQSAMSFDLIFKELSSLNGNYKDQLQLMYTNISYTIEKIIACSSYFSNSTCSEPAKIKIDLQRPQKMESIQRKIIENREKHLKLIEDILKYNIDDLVFFMQKLEHTIRLLLIAQMELYEKKQDCKEINQVAIDFFYDLLKYFDENNKSLTPVYEIYSSVVRELGIFIQTNQETEGIKILEISLKRPELLELLSELLIPSGIKAEYFLKMYKFIIDSCIRHCDTKVLFVLMSKFDLPNWLQGMRPKFSEISALLKLILTGLENWNQPETSLLQDLFRRHLVHVYEYDFPEHFGEVLQAVLNSTSEQKISAMVLVDLLNSLLLSTTGCESINLEDSPVNYDKIHNQLKLFSTQQNLFNFKSATDTIGVLTKHFQQERLQHGLHGLYPKHSNYCLSLSLWFSCMSYTSMVCAVCSYPGVLGDQICDWVFAPVIDLYSPWIVVYRNKDLHESTAAWIKQFIQNGKIMYPWSELHTQSAQLMIKSLINSLLYILETLPVSNSILGHIFNWYQYHFASIEISSYIREPIHSALIKLPWTRLVPQPIHIEAFSKILCEFLPDCHSFAGRIFIQIQWADWKQNSFDIWTTNVQNTCIPTLFTLYIQIVFEPTLHDESKTSEILLNSLKKYPWHCIDVNGIETVMNWFVTSIEPTIVLRIPSESNATDNAVLKLLEYSCGMSANHKLNNSTSILQSKQILYTKGIVRLLFSCATKNQKLIETPIGLQCYRNCIVELLNSLEAISNDDVDCANNLISIIISSLQNVPTYTGKLFVDAIIYWQSTSMVGNPLLLSTISAIGTCKSYTQSIYLLLEATIYNYFKGPDLSNSAPTWTMIFSKLDKSIANAELQIILKNSNLLVLHVYMLYRIQNVSDIGEKITFLQDISQLMETVKTNELTESRIVIIYGAIITCGCKILNLTNNAKKPLLMLARYLQVISKQSEGWSDSILGVIGLKWDKSNLRRKILNKCLSCLVFALFPDPRGGNRKISREFQLALDELKLELNNKIYVDIKPISLHACEIIEDNLYPQTDEVIEKVFNVIQLFYNDNFIKSCKDVWIIEK